MTTRFLEKKSIFFRRDSAWQVLLYTNGWRFWIRWYMFALCQFVFSHYRHTCHAYRRLPIYWEQLIVSVIYTNAVWLIFYPRIFLQNYFGIRVSLQTKLEKYISASVSLKKNYSKTSYPKTYTYLHLFSKQIVKHFTWLKKIFSQLIQRDEYKSSSLNL